MNFTNQSNHSELMKAHGEFLSAKSQELFREYIRISTEVATRTIDFAISDGFNAHDTLLVGLIASSIYMLSDVKCASAPAMLRKIFDNTARALIERGVIPADTIHDRVVK